METGWSPLTPRRLHPNLPRQPRFRGFVMSQLQVIVQTLWNIVVDFASIVVQLLSFALSWSLVIAWLAWWLWGVNWKKLRPVLAQGGWAPSVLVLLVCALVWSRVAPSTGNFLGLTLPNFWWQL